MPIATDRLGEELSGNFVHAGSLPREFFGCNAATLGKYSPSSAIDDSTRRRHRRLPHKRPKGKSCAIFQSAPPRTSPPPASGASSGDGSSGSRVVVLSRRRHIGEATPLPRPSTTPAQKAGLGHPRRPAPLTMLAGGPQELFGGLSSAANGLAPAERHRRIPPQITRGASPERGFAPRRGCPNWRWAVRTSTQFRHRKRLSLDLPTPLQKWKGNPSANNRHTLCSRILLSRCYMN